MLKRLDGYSFWCCWKTQSHSEVPDRQVLKIFLPSLPQLYHFLSNFSFIFSGLDLFFTKMKQRCTKLTLKPCPTSKLSTWEIQGAFRDPWHTPIWEATTLLAASLTSLERFPRSSWWTVWLTQSSASMVTWQAPLTSRQMDTILSAWMTWKGSWESSTSPSEERSWMLLRFTPTCTYLTWPSSHPSRKPTSTTSTEAQVSKPTCSLSSSPLGRLRWSKVSKNPSRQKTGPGVRRTGTSKAVDCLDSTSWPPLRILSSFWMVALIN